MDIRIGITYSPREISLESNQTAAQIQELVSQAIDTGAKHFSLSDDKGSVYIVPVANLGYVEIGAENQRRVGFVA